MSCWIKISLISGCLAATFTIALAISVVYIFDVEKDNFVVGECTVLSCNVVFSQCPFTVCSDSGDTRICNTYEEDCFIATIIFILNTTNTRYIGADESRYPLRSQADDRCDNFRENSLVTCYYDMTSPGDVLSLNPAKIEIGGIIVIVVFTVCDAIFLALFVISFIFSPKPKYSFKCISHSQDIA